jgi:hypothetical protein
MKLDNEKQQAQLLQILESITLQGTRKQVMESLTELNALVLAITMASIDSPLEPKESKEPKKL